MAAIIQSLLDLDFYKFTMGQVAFRHFREVPVTFAFINRTSSVPLAGYIEQNELRAELEAVQSLRFQREELDFLRESPHIPRGLFTSDYLGFLAALRLPDLDIAIEGSGFRIEASGRWPEATLWETLILSVVTELYSRAVLKRRGLTRDEAWVEGERRLARKVALIKRDSRVRFSDFGTRRRFSRAWQKHVVEVLQRELPEQFIGTSNVRLARELGLRPIGTFAHEMDMVFSGIYHGSDDEIRASHNKVLQLWWEQYGQPMSIALTDTYGTGFFLRDFTPDQAKAWRGVRHDSGDPFEFGEKMIAFYERLGIDPRSKVIVFSDGLEAELILQLVDRFHDRIQVVFGWGTNLTNDVCYDPPSLIAKPVRACGHGVVKLGDNFDKAIGALEDIERFMRIFDYGEVRRFGVKY